MTLPEGGGEGAKVEPRCQRGQAGDVIVVSEVGIGDSENGEGGAVREGHGELRGEGEEGSELTETHQVQTIPLSPLCFFFFLLSFYP